MCLTSQDHWEQVCLLLFHLHCDGHLVHPKGNQSWIFIGKTDAEAPTLWPPDTKHDSEKILYWERLKEGGEGANRGWDGWMASPTLWTWVWASSRSWWWTGKPDVLQFMGSQSVGHYWATELNWDTQEVASSLWPQSRWRWSFSKLSERSCFSPKETARSTCSWSCCWPHILVTWYRGDTEHHHFPHPQSHVFKVKDHCCWF